MSERQRFTYWAGGAVFVLALAIRLAMVAAYSSTPVADDALMFPDAAYYLARARAIAAGDWLGSTAAYLSPGYTGWLGVNLAMLGSVTAVKYMQAILGAATCAALVPAGAQLRSPWTGLVAGVALAVYGLHIDFAGHVMPATLATLVGVVGLWWVLRAWRRPTRARWLLAGLALGLGVVIRPNGLLLLILLPVFWSARPRPASPRPWLWLSLGAALAIGPVTALNYAASERLVLVSTTGGRNLLKGNGPEASGSHGPLAGRGGTGLQWHLTAAGPAARAVDDDREKRREAFRYVARNPANAARLWLRKLAFTLNAHELGAAPQWLARHMISLAGMPWLGFGWLAPLGLAGLAMGGRRRRTAPLVAFTLAQVASFVLVFVVARFRLIFVACLCLWAGWLLELAYVRMRGSWQRGQLVPAAWALAAILLVHWPWLAWPADGGAIAPTWLRVADELAAREKHGAALVAYGHALGGVRDREGEMAELIRERTEACEQAQRESGR